MAKPDGVSVKISDEQHRALIAHLRTQNRIARFVLDSTRKLALDTINQIASISPVDTGRLRAGFFPIFRADWAGPEPPARGRDARAIAEGRRHGSAKETQTRGAYRIRIANSVDYVGFVEERYGFIERAFKLERRRFGRELSRDLDRLVAEARKGARRR